MTFLSPWALYLFALAAVVVVAYFLRRRAEPYRVSALFLWQEIEARGRRALLFVRRSLWLLLLQLAALTLLILAIANPAYYSAGLSGRLAIIIDGSASMQVSRGGVSRYELAVERALELLDSAAGELTLIQAQRRPRLLVPLTQEKRRAREALGSSRPTLEGDASLEQIWQLLQSQGPLADFSRIFYLTDHPVRGAGESLPLEVIGLGEPAANLALSAFAIRPEPEPGSGYSVFVRAENYTDEPAEPVLTISADGAPIFSERIALAAHSGRALALSHPGPLPRTATAALEAGDDFPWDDRRYFAFPPLERRVLWLGRDDRFLRGALLAAGEFAITRDPGDGEFDLIVANGAEVPADLKGNILLVNASYPPLVQLLGLEEISSPPRAAAHPLLAGVEPGSLAVARAARASLPSGGEVLLSAAGLPLIYLKRLEAQRICFIAFDLRWSNLVLTVDFPILMKNLLGWLLPPLAGGEALAYHEVGEPLPLETAVEVTDPRGKTSRAGEALIPELPGLYRLDSPRGSSYLAVNLAPAESEPGEPLDAPSGSALAGLTHERSALRPLWEYLALGGLLALVLESIRHERPSWRIARRKG
ncbi:MAG: VWA domain-containing protein [Candidatus Acetothermia bacterium]|jgi:hypothetical protein|nr:VWA domain-containing protein [Candidatus Acetothermia bacterium]MDH7505303.1 VWA domain-containing protein [Candidatus Acetothermia bacterium]